MMDGNFRKKCIERLGVAVIVLLTGLWPSAVGAIEFDQVVAEIAGEEIVFEQLLPSKESREARADKLSKRAYSRWVFRYAASSLRLLALRTFRTQLREELGIEPSKDQIESFVYSMNFADTRELNEVRRKIAQLEIDVEDAKPNSANYAKIIAELTTLRERLALLKANKEFRDAHPELHAALDKKVAHRALTIWLIDRELYLRYGGRVAFRYAGPEPIDAYIALLKERQKAGTLIFYSSVLEQEFWRYFYREGRVLLIPREEADEIYRNQNWALSDVTPAQSQEKNVDP